MKGDHVGTLSLRVARAWLQQEDPRGLADPTDRAPGVRAMAPPFLQQDQGVGLRAGTQPGSVGGPDPGGRGACSESHVGAGARQEAGSQGGEAGSQGFPSVPPPPCGAPVPVGRVHGVGGSAARPPTAPRPCALRPQLRFCPGSWDVLGPRAHGAAASQPVPLSGWAGVGRTAAGSRDGGKAPFPTAAGGRDSRHRPAVDRAALCEDAPNAPGRPSSGRGRREALRSGEMPPRSPTAVANVSICRAPGRNSETVPPAGSTRANGQVHVRDTDTNKRKQPGKPARRSEETRVLGSRLPSEPSVPPTPVSGRSRNLNATEHPGTTGGSALRENGSIFKNVCNTRQNTVCPWGSG